MIGDGVQQGLPQVGLLACRKEGGIALRPERNASALDLYELPHAATGGVHIEMGHPIIIRDDEQQILSCLSTTEEAVKRVKRMLKYP
jgi:hypothetical protein